MKSKPCISILALLCLSASANYSIAQTTDKNAPQKTLPVHRIGISPKIGYAAMLNNTPDARMIGGYGLGLGLNYELRYKRFLFNTGIDFDFLNSTTRLNDFSIQRPMLEPYTTMNYQYNFSRYRDIQNMGNLSVPLLFGAEFGKVFFLAGAKFSYPVIGNYREKTQLAIIANDEEFIDPMENMPNHLLTNYSPVGKNKLTYNFNTSLVAEVGIDLDEWLAYKPKRRRGQRNRRKTFKECLHYRASVFAEYGVLNSNNFSANQPAGGTWLAFAEQGTDALLTASAVATQSEKIHPLFVGAKFTIQYEVQPLVKKKKPAPRPQSRPQSKPKPKPQPKPVPPQPKMVFVVLDAKTMLPIPATVEIYSTNDDLLFQKQITDAVACQTQLVPNTYNAYITSTGYLPYAEDFVFTNDTVQLLLQPAEQGTKVVLKNLFFATNKTKILSESEQALDDLTQFMQQNPEVRIQIIGHTDSVGKPEANQRLSEGRANSVRNELILRGIEPERVEAIGKGQTEPIDTNDTEEGRQNNRRVEFIIL